MQIQMNSFYTNNNKCNVVQFLLLRRYLSKPVLKYNKTRRSMYFKVLFYYLNYLNLLNKYINF